MFGLVVKQPGEPDGWFLALLPGDVANTVGVTQILERFL